MKYFLIKYRFQDGSREAWHREIAEFIAALNADPAIAGKIVYRCMRRRDGDDYYHFAGAADDQAIKALQSLARFAHYTEETKRVSGNTVEVLPLEVIAETNFIG
jgi:quinol monooxygenase YgiN